MNHGWETITLAELRRRLKSVRDKFAELPADKEVRFREYTDPATREIIVRVIPHTGVIPND